MEQTEKQQGYQGKNLGISGITETMLIYLVIAVAGLLSGAFDRILNEENEDRKSILRRSVIYAAVYHWCTAVLRTIMSNGAEYMTYSFFGKTVSAYIKVCIMAVTVYVLLFLLSRVRILEKLHGLIEYIAAYYSVMTVLFIIFIRQPYMRDMVIIGVLAIVISVVRGWFCRDLQVADRQCTEKSIYLMIGCALILYILLYMIAGPTELMVYNLSDFAFSYREAITALAIMAVFFFVPMVILAPYYLSNIENKVISGAISVYCILSYVQGVFLNGQLTMIDGSRQTWTPEIVRNNVILWVIVAFVMVLSFFIPKAGSRIIVIAAAYISAIQLVTCIYMICTTGALRTNEHQLTEEGVFDLSEDSNVVIFILDAFDVQMLKTVTDSDPGYIGPLHDFTYYDDMESRYVYTNGSLPYLLTGANIDDPNIEEDQDQWYKDTTFLKDIQDAGYDIRILTEGKYVAPLERGIVSNYSADHYCRIDPEKTMQLFARCMRFRNMPYAVKPMCRYEAYHITNVIVDTNTYIFGWDADFDEKIRTEGLTGNCRNKAFRIYHLYGAHSPYYLSEDATTDYSSTPIRQWKGALKIVYDYMAEMQDKGLYDDSTIIIMADHGYNKTQYKSAIEAGIQCDESRTNPIFIIKKAGESGENMKIDDRSVSHDDFFDTIRECIGLDDKYYGTIWD